MGQRSKKKEVRLNLSARTQVSQVGLRDSVLRDTSMASGADSQAIDACMLLYAVMVLVLLATSNFGSYGMRCYKITTLEPTKCSFC